MIRSFLLAAAAIAVIAGPLAASPVVERYRLPCVLADTASCEARDDSVAVIYQVAIIGWTFGQWPPETLAVRNLFTWPDSVGGMPGELAPRCRPDSIEWDDRGIPWQYVIVCRTSPAGNWSCWSKIREKGWPVAVFDPPSTSSSSRSRFDWYDVAGRRVQNTGDAAWRPQGVGVYFWRERIRGSTVRAGRFVQIRSRRLQ